MQTLIPIVRFTCFIRFTRRSAQRVGGLLLLSALTFTACKNKCDNADFAIQKIQPAANPAGYEVFITATGVGPNTIVRFDEVEAVVQNAEGGLIAKIPVGLSGPVTLSIEEGDCKDSKPFDVLGSYPGNVPASPTVIVVPQAPGGYPSGITNPWPNVFDQNHKVFMSDFDYIGIFQAGSSEFHDNLPFFNGNPISGNYDTLANTIFMVIDRSGKAGGYKDTLTGQFIPNIPESEILGASATILLVSKRTGRQLVIYKP